MELTDYKITEHCKKRYSERIIGNSDTNSINRFVAENEDKIKTDINKMITYGECIYVGKQSQKDGKGKVLNVYLKDTWVVLVDTSSNNVVTIYKIDLECGDDFNLQYVSKMMEKINQSKDDLTSAKLEVETESSVYRELIDSYQGQINEYKAMIKNLETLCSSYQTIIDHNIVKVSQANREVADLVNSLIGKKEF